MTAAETLEAAIEKLEEARRLLYDIDEGKTDDGQFAYDGGSAEYLQETWGSVTDAVVVLNCFKANNGLLEGISGEFAREKLRHSARRGRL